MTTYSGDIQKMTQQELENALKQVAANWRGRPYLSNDYSEGLRYGELRDALQDRFGITMKIKAVNHSIDYWAV
ncbi:MAG: hypothetical protein WC762_03470 [Methylobacter sp.]